VNTWILTQATLTSKFMRMLPNITQSPFRTNFYAASDGGGCVGGGSWNVRTELAARLDPSRGLCAVGWDRTLQTDRQTAVPSRSR